MIESNELPSTFELASIAAQLIDRRGATTPETAASESLILWRSCQGLLEREQLIRRITQPKGEWPKPFPLEKDKISLDKFLELIFDMTKADDRLARYRQYLREKIRELEWQRAGH